MNSLFNFLYTSKYIKRIDDSIKCLDNDTNLTRESFFIYRVILEVIVFILCLFIPVYKYIISIIMTILFHFLYEEFVLFSRVEDKSKLQEIECFEYFKLVILGLNGDSSINDCLLSVCEVCKNSFSKELKNELKKNNYMVSFNIIANRTYSSSIKELLFDLCCLSNKDDFIKSVNKYIKDRNKIMNNDILYRVNLLPIKILILSIIMIVLVLCLIIMGPKYI